ncbi:MAG TPA: hypothetical protein EYN68_11010 [Candidatus Marinimicrobia bacterium]|nr:hypothetical protein [Candidatus Neomarinimicrobiota bacterium]
MSVLPVQHFCRRFRKRQSLRHHLRSRMHRNDHFGCLHWRGVGNLLGILRQRLADEVGVLGRKVGMGKQQMFVQVKQSTQRHLANVNI